MGRVLTIVCECGNRCVLVVEMIDGEAQLSWECNNCGKSQTKVSFPRSGNDELYKNLERSE